MAGDRHELTQAAMFQPLPPPPPPSRRCRRRPAAAAARRPVRVLAMAAQVKSGITLNSNPTEQQLKVRRLRGDDGDSSKGAGKNDEGINDEFLWREAVSPFSGSSLANQQELGVRSWPTWGCEASKFPWSYDSTGERGPGGAA